MKEKKSQRSEFTLKVIKIVKRIPKGKVATYGQVAKLAGKPQGVRGVVWILHSSSSTQGLPWHRVINSKGRISFSPMSRPWHEQIKLLRQEGVELGEGDVIDLEVFQWKK